MSMSVARNELARMQDDFISIISDELRTPLGVIKGYVTTLLRDDTFWDDETRHELLFTIDEETSHLEDLIDGLLDSSRLIMGSFNLSITPTDIRTLIKQAVKKETSNRSGADISYTFDDAIPKLKIDPSRILRVIHTFLRRAMKDSEGAALSLRAFVSGESVRVEIFNPVSPGKPTSSPRINPHTNANQETMTSVLSTDISLYICRKIIDSHMGRIGIQIDPERGIIYYFTLPIEPGSQLNYQGEVYEQK
jgi:K+-sensing histidine kinase KdpD